MPVYNLPSAHNNSGLDNAGKTTIVKRVNGEDISTISPTLGGAVGCKLTLARESTYL